VRYTPITTTEDVEALRMGIAREDHYLEFKEIGNDGRSWVRPEECARDIAQFANARGGTIIVGALEKDHVLVGLQDVGQRDDIPEWIDSVLKEHLEPVPPIGVQLIDARDGKRLFAVNIPPALRLIARKAGKGYEFPIRAENTKRYMTLIEVEARMDNYERSATLRMMRIDRNDAVILDAPTVGVDPRGWNVAAIDDDIVTFSKGELIAYVPLAYVRAVYRTMEPDATWVIGLSATISRVGASGTRQEHCIVRRGRNL
jgi:hypothetical protein